jgi:hypothetical protein
MPVADAMLAGRELILLPAKPPLTCSLRVQHLPSSLANRQPRTGLVTA